VISAPLPHDEAARLDALHQYEILDTPPEAAFDDLVQVAATVCDVPIALVSLIDEARQWFKARMGVGAAETPRQYAFCAHTILQHDVMIVPDACADPRFVDNPLVTSDPHIRFYAGTPLETASGHRLGTLCVIDRKPRILTKAQVDMLKRLGRQVVRQLELRLLSEKLTESNTDLSFIKQVVEQMEEPIYWLRPAEGFRFVYVNEAAVRHYGYPRATLLQMRVTDWNPDITPAQLEHNWAKIKQQRSLILETRHRLHDGLVVPVEVTANYVEVGGQEYIAGTIRRIEARKQAEQREKAHRDLLAAISAVQSTFIVESNASKAFQTLLEALLKLTESQYGFIGEVLVKDDGARYLKTHAITDIAWNEATRALYDGNAPMMEFYNLQTLFGHVIRTGEPVLSNDPLHDVRRGGLPKGHPPLTAFLGLPLFDGQRLIGMVGVANRAGGYDEAMIGYLEPFLRTCSSIIGAYRLDKERQQAERSRGVLTYAIDQGMEGVALLDGEGRYTYMNSAHAALYGYAVEQLTGKTWRELYAPGVVTLIEQQVFPLLLQQGSWNGELVGRRSDGSVFDVEVSLRLLGGPVAGGTEVLACTCRDITLKKQAEAEIKKSHLELERRVHERTTELTEANRQLRRLSRELIRTQETERRSLARDLHDEVGQALTALNINLQILKAQTDGAVDDSLRESLQLSAQLLQQVRQLAVDLRPQLLDELGLEQALRVYVTRQGERNGWQVSFSTVGESGRLSDEVAVTCYRVLQESLTNAARYAQATRVAVQLQWTDGSVEVSIEDDGVGFDVATVVNRASAEPSSGLRGMDERVRLSGGRMAIQSAPQGGCAVRVWLPLGQDNEQQPARADVS